MQPAGIAMATAMTRGSVSSRSVRPNAPPTTEHRWLLVRPCAELAPLVMAGTPSSAVSSSFSSGSGRRSAGAAESRRRKRSPDVRPVAAYFRSLDPRLPPPVYVLELGALVNAFGNGVVLPFLLIYLHNVRGIPFGLAGSAAAVQSVAALASGFLGGTLSDRVGPKRVLLGALVVMTVAFAPMPAVRTALDAFLVYSLWGIGRRS